MANKIIPGLFFLFLTLSLSSQERLGINTPSPVRTLELTGSSDEHIRVHSSSPIGIAGIEMFRGQDNMVVRDWKFENDNGVFKIATSDDNFDSGSSEVIRISTSGNTGIGTNSPATTLHVDGGTALLFGGEGYMKTGTNSSYNLTFDNAQILAMNNNAAAPLYFQANGGDTHFGLNGGNTYMSTTGGRAGVGTNTLDAGLNINQSGFHLYIENELDDINSWHIGASSDTWQTGDDQLIFSPTGNSGDAVLRLMDVTENDGVNAPVMIHSTTDQTLLLDGNEIDTRGEPLYINHNSDEETYINPSGGKVGIGTTNPQATLHVTTTSGHTLSLQQNTHKWNVSPVIGGTENLGFYWDDNNDPWGQVHGLTGQWMHISDRNLKENISPLCSVMDRLKQVNLYSYSFINDTAKKTFVGVIAQDTEPLFPEMVHVNEGQYGVSYAQLAVVGLKGIQEQQILIESLREKIDRLKSDPDIASKLTSLHTAD